MLKFHFIKIELTGYIRTACNVIILVHLALLNFLASGWAELLVVVVEALPLLVTLSLPSSSCGSSNAMSPSYKSQDGMVLQY